MPDWKTDELTKRLVTLITPTSGKKVDILVMATFIKLGSWFN